MTEQAHLDEGYDGPAEVVVDDDTVLPVQVSLRGLFQPIDGRFHWYGRITQDDRLDAAARSGGSVVLRTPEGEATGRLSDRDPWGRLRISATGAPPFDHAG